MTQVIEPKAIQPISLPEISKRVSLSKILVTTDFSPESDRALAYALALARRYDARIYLAHVLVPDAFLYAEPAVAEATYEKVRQAAEQGMADILVSGKLRGIPHEVLLGEGNVWPVLAKLIQKYEIDLVVTATHGRGKIKKLLIGSVAEEIFRHADCAVLTVGPRVKDEPPREVELKSILGCVAESMGENSYCCEQMDFFPPPTILSERSSPSRVRFAAPKNRRALDGSGPL